MEERERENIYTYYTKTFNILTFDIEMQILKFFFTFILRLFTGK